MNIQTYHFYWPKRVGENVVNNNCIIKLKCICWLFIRSINFTYIYFFNPDFKLSIIIVMSGGVVAITQSTARP